MKKIADEEFFIKNSELSMEFSRYVLEHSEMDDILTEDKVVVFLPEFDSELKKFKDRLRSLRYSREISKIERPQN